MKNKNKGLALSLSRGFTLIELLITIAIIGILASVILVSLNNSKNRSNGAALKSTLSSLKAAVALCCTNTSNTLMVGYIGGQSLCSDASMSNTLLPTEDDLGMTTGVGTLRYLSGGPFQCNGATPRLRIVVGDTKNAACGNTDYFITPAEVRYGTTLSNFPGFPPGC